MRTNKEQLTALGIDNVSGIVYSTDQLSSPHQGRQVFYGIAKPSRCPTVYDMFQNCLLGRLLPLTKECVKVISGSQTRLRKEFNLRRLHTRLRKGILNSFIMRKSTRLKENKYGQI